jgi:hypothetical protein
MRKGSRVLVEGPTLADRIAKGALPLDEALGFHDAEWSSFVT